MSTLSTPAVEQRYPGRDALVEALRDTIADDLRTAIRTRGCASLVLSGGSTPRSLFAALSRQRLPWGKVRITLADERWVAPDHPDSNERLVRDHLLQREASAASLLGLKTPEPTPEAGREACEHRLATFERPFDVVVLGLGTDGHTASLFPGAAQLASGLDLRSPRACLAVRSPVAPHPRMSLTLAALLDSRRLVLHITGDRKWQVYQQALEPGPVEALPIRAVLRSGQLEVWWAP